MKARPTIFLSGVTHELGSFRDAVKIEIEMKGCFGESQPGFPPDWRTVEEMLRRKLQDSDAVIHIVGFRYGAEPNQRPADKPRRSYTQMEFDIAREMQKPVYVFISADAALRDPANPDEKDETPETVQLQVAHRDAVQRTNHLYYFFKDKAELCKLVAEIPMIAHAGDFRADLGRIDRYAPAELIGREAELKMLHDAWLKVRRVETPRPRIITLVALGGEGKTSLVAKWAAELAGQDWPGCDAAFAWSFYSQGTRDQVAASSDLFLKEALTFFALDEKDKEFAASSAGAFEKGQRLARLVGQRRSLLILDGLEPLQYAPTSTAPGQLKDHCIAALLRGLAVASHGLCVVTTRYSFPDLKAFWQTTAPEVKLLRLSRDAGVHLLQSFGVKGSLLRNIEYGLNKEKMNEFEKLVEDVKGHALTLNLLGTYLRDAHVGDIRKRDLIKFEEADSENEHPNHAFHVMDAYVEWFETGGKNEEENKRGLRALALLRLLGLFDRPADADCLQALWTGDSIPNLTEPLTELKDTERNISLTRLEAAKLLTVNRDASGALDSLDAHLHLREYFAKQLREQNPDAWRAAHRRLYEHLCATTEEGEQPTLENLQLLYQAVAHGCLAEMQLEAFGTYYARTVRTEEKYAIRKLGAYESNLEAVAGFFETPWKRVSPAFTHADKAWLLNEAAYSLRSLGRLTEALDPMRVGLQMRIEQESWLNAVISANNLTALVLSLGDVASAIVDAEKSVTYADRSGSAVFRVDARATQAHTLHQAGRRAEAEAGMREAESLQVESDAKLPLLYSVAGFRYCNLLLVDAERAAWQRTLHSSILQQTNLLESCRAVAHRATQGLSISQSNNWPHTIGLYYLTLGCASLYQAVLEGTSFDPSGASLEKAVEALRRNSRQDCIPCGLLTRAWYRSFICAHTGPESAQEDLDEAWEIAERGPMKLHLADIHLYRARLFFREAKYPWESPTADLAAARSLIEKCGYGLRKDELEDAEFAILGTSP